MREPWAELCRKGFAQVAFEPSTLSKRGLRHTATDYQSLKTGAGGAAWKGVSGPLRQCRIRETKRAHISECSSTDYWEEPSKAAAVSSGYSGSHHVEGSVEPPRPARLSSKAAVSEAGRLAGLRTKRPGLSRFKDVAPLHRGSGVQSRHEMTRLSIMLTCGSVAAAGNLH